MDRVFETIIDLKSKTENLIMDINQLKDRDNISEKALGVLLKIVELEQRYKQSLSATGVTVNDLNSKPSDKNVSEINKVQNKLQLWSNTDKQNQINVKILNKYLELAEGNGKQITVDDFREKYGNDSEFLRNYPQMKIISPKNNCKVFDEENKVVSIWEPVKQHVDEYKKAVQLLKSKA